MTDIIAVAGPVGGPARGAAPGPVGQGWRNARDPASGKDFAALLDTPAGRPRTVAESGAPDLAPTEDEPPAPAGSSEDPAPPDASAMPATDPAASEGPPLPGEAGQPATDEDLPFAMDAVGGPVDPAAVPAGLPVPEEAFPDGFQGAASQDPAAAVGTGVPGTGLPANPVVSKGPGSRGPAMAPGALQAADLPARSGAEAVVAALVAGLGSASGEEGAMPPEAASGVGLSGPAVPSAVSRAPAGPMGQAAEPAVAAPGAIPPPVGGAASPSGPGEGRGRSLRTVAASVPPRTDSPAPPDLRNAERGPAGSALPEAARFPGDRSAWGAPVTRPAPLVRRVVGQPGNPAGGAVPESRENVLASSDGAWPGDRVPPLAPAFPEAVAARAGTEDLSLGRHVARQVADQPVLRTGGAAELSLNPEELGPLRLTVEGSEGALRVVIEAARPETADLLRRHVEALRQELRQEGLGLVDVSIGGGDSRQGGEASQRGGMAARLPQGPPGAEAFAASTAAAPATRGGALTGHLDLRF